MNEIFENDPNYNRLTRLVETGDTVAVVGSGLSTGIYPSWVNLIQWLSTVIKDENVQDLSEDTDVAILTRYAQKALNQNKDSFVEILKDEFRDKTHTHDGYRYLALSPFKSYVTLNFDTLLLKQLTPIKNKTRTSDNNFKTVVYPHVKPDMINQGALFHVHGIIAPFLPLNVKELVLTESSFKVAYDHESSRLPSFWEELTMNNVVIFIACGLREPEVRNVLKICNLKRKFQISSGITPPPLFVLKEA